jgi:hypothetical protein
MTRQTRRHNARSKEIRAWGIRRREVDINQLALAYYLLARRRIDAQRQVMAERATASTIAALPAAPNSQGGGPAHAPEAA